MNTRLLICAVMALGGCSFSDTIKSDTLTYDEVIEDTTDKMLLMNVLRARDKAPMHFADIPLIHESLQASASTGLSVPYGPSNRGTARDTFTLGASVQSAPTFDVSHLDAKDFVTGIASPVDPKFVKYWLDRGLDYRLVLLLFFSTAEVTGNVARAGQAPEKVSIKVANDPRGSLATILHDPHTHELPCNTKTPFERYLSLIGRLPNFFATSYSERRLIARNVEIGQKTALKDLLALDTTKFSLVETEANPPTYALYSISPGEKIALCYRHTEGLAATGLSISTQTSSPSEATKACTQSTIWQTAPETPKTADTSPRELRSENPQYCEMYDAFERDLVRPAPNAAAPGTYSDLTLRLSIRSVGEMIQYLGDILAYQDTLGRPNPYPGLNNPVTLGFCPNRIPGGGAQGCNEIGGVFFNVRDDLRVTPGSTRFSLFYRGQTYGVRKFDSDSGPGAPASELDHTLEVLGVLHQMIDLNKSATDLKSTPYVQVIP